MFQNNNMLLTTTSTLDGRKIKQYLGIVTGETILGANFFRDIVASFTDVLGGRSAAYENTMIEAKETAMKEMTDRARQMGANAIIAIDLDYETLGQANGMMMVTCTGTAVVVE